MRQEVIRNKAGKPLQTKLSSNFQTKKKTYVFLLWGGYAKKKGKVIDSDKHHVLVSGHPSPLSANRGYWFGNEHFSKTNTILERINKSKILW